MRIVSTNLAQLRTVLWNGAPVQTGIFKYPVTPPISLGKEDVVGDRVVERKFHGGFDKACYLFSLDHYPYWRARYPQLEWDEGMFGENLTVKGLDETQLHIGDIYRIGEALVQVSQPRQPCFKLGIRFGDQGIIKPFIKSGHSGTYVRVLEEGRVHIGDELQLVERNEEAITIRDLFWLLYNQKARPEDFQAAAATPALAESAVQSLEKRLRLALERVAT